MNSFVLLSSAAFGLPVVQAKASEAVSSTKHEMESTKKVKPSSLPLYPEAEKLEYTLQPPNPVENYVRDARIQATKIKQDYQPVLDKVSYIISTGKAHTNEAIIQLRDESNLVGRIGFMAAGGLLGLIAARRGRFLKKVTYLSLGLTGTGSICYPKEAKVYAASAGCFAARNARIAYHFVVGSRPTVQNENGKAFDKMANMVSDVWQWGFRLFERKEPEVKVTEETASEKPVLAESDAPSSEIKEEAAQALNEAEETEPAEVTASQLDEPATADEPAISSQESSIVVEQTPVPVLEAPAEQQTEVPVEQTTETPVETSSPEPVKETQSDADAQSTTSKSTLQLEGDLGQGNPEDKELYTTRE